MTQVFNTIPYAYSIIFIIATIRWSNESWHVWEEIGTKYIRNDCAMAVLHFRGHKKAELLMCCNLNVKSQEGLSTVELLGSWMLNDIRTLTFLRWEFDQDRFQRFQADFCQDATSMNVLRTESLHALGCHPLGWRRSYHKLEPFRHLVTLCFTALNVMHSEFIDTIPHPFAADIRSHIGYQNNAIPKRIKTYKNIQEHRESPGISPW